MLGGISPIDPDFVQNAEGRRACSTHVDVVAVHGFPLDWNHWQIDEWPDKLAEIRAVTDLPVWVSEVGVSTFGAEEVQEFGLRRTAELLHRASRPRIHWYSLYRPAARLAGDDAPPRGRGLVVLPALLHGPAARGRHAEARAAPFLASYTPELGICQWFHFEDHRLDDAVRWLSDLGVRHLRTGLSWADSFRPDAQHWFDRQMRALEPFDVTVTFCFTPESAGVRPHHTSPPREPRDSPNSAPPKSAGTWHSGSLRGGHYSMNANRLQLAPAFRRLATLQRRVETQHDTTVQQAVDELLRSLNELRGGQAQLLAQREEIEAIRAALRAERERYTQLFDGAPDPYLVTDSQLTILSANRAGADLFNISQRFLSGKALSVFLSKDRDRFIADAARLASAGESEDWTFGIRPRERAPLEVSARVVVHATPEGVELHWVLRPA